MELIYRGKCWKFGDNLSVDHDLMPHEFSTTRETRLEILREHVMEHLDPEFHKQTSPGDIIVAGKRFGVAFQGSCGPPCMHRSWRGPPHAAAVRRREGGRGMQIREGKRLNQNARACAFRSADVWPDALLPKTDSVRSDHIPATAGWHLGLSVPGCRARQRRATPDATMTLSQIVRGGIVPWGGSFQGARW